MNKILEECKKAVKDEPEFPGEMPEELWALIKTVGIPETMRIVARMTKQNILKRMDKIKV